MNKEMNLNEIISELNRIGSLYDQHQSLLLSMDNISVEKKAEDDEWSAEIVVGLNEFREKQDKKFEAEKPRIASDCLILPPEPPKAPSSSNPAKDILVGVISGLLALVSFAFWIIMVIANPENDAFGLIMLSVFMMLGSVGHWFLSGSGKVTTFMEWQKEQNAWKEKQAEWEAKFNQSATKEESERFLNEFKKYDDCFLKLVDTCSEKYSKELERYGAGLEEIRQKYLNKLEEIRSEILKVEEQLDGVTLIHSNLFSNANRISSMLSLGRADSLKEAINLALDEERKDMEEAARREEARKQESILEQQAFDNRLHNEAMQRVAEDEARATREHNRAMERAAQAQAQAAQAQAREAARQSEIAQRQARDAQRAASARCASCVNSTKCTFKAKQNAGSCGAYRPR